MVQSVERAFAILDAVAKRPAGVTALADRLDLPKSTVARLLGLARGARRGRAPRRQALAGRPVGRSASRERFRPSGASPPLARPALVELVRSLGEDAGLGLPDGYDVLYVDQVECDHPVQVRDWTGTRAPMHAVPSGLVLMADWPEDAVDAYVARGLAALTPRTVVDPDAAARAPRGSARGGLCVGARGVRRRASTRSRRRSVTREEMPSQRSTSTGPRTASRLTARRSGWRAKSSSPPPRSAVGWRAMSARADLIRARVCANFVPKRLREGCAAAERSTRDPAAEGEIPRRDGRLRPGRPARAGFGSSPAPSNSVVSRQGALAQIAGIRSRAGRAARPDRSRDVPRSARSPRTS